MKNIKKIQKKLSFFLFLIKNDLVLIHYTL